MSPAGTAATAASASSSAGVLLLLLVVFWNSHSGEFFWKSHSGELLQPYSGRPAPCLAITAAASGWATPPRRCLPQSAWQCCHPLPARLAAAPWQHWGSGTCPAWDHSRRSAAGAQQGPLTGLPAFARPGSLGRRVDMHSCSCFWRKAWSISIHAARSRRYSHSGVVRLAASNEPP